jgi:hypothetical protein
VAKEWDLLVVVAREVARTDPQQERAWIGWACGLRRLGMVATAREVLLDGEVHHGARSAQLHYNLACCNCLLGDLEAARMRLGRACKLCGRHLKALAQDEPDLQALREDIAARGPGRTQPGPFIRRVTSRGPRCGSW